MATQQRTIPMFPLNLVLFPGETKTLHVYEERYKQLISDCIENQANFGIPFYNNNRVENFGTEVVILNIIKSYDDGSMDITIEGLKVFRLLEFSEVLYPKLYGAGTITYEEVITNRPSVEIQELIKDYLWLSQQTITPIDAFDNSNIYHIARLIDISLPEKYEIIKAPTFLKKEELLKPKIRLFMHLLEVENNLKSKFVLN
jgi:hypothetical protein